MIHSTGKFGLVLLTGPFVSGDKIEELVGSLVTLHSSSQPGEQGLCPRLAPLSTLTVTPHGFSLSCPLGVSTPLGLCPLRSPGTPSPELALILISFGLLLVYFDDRPNGRHWN